jgi:ATP-binding cassette subfamily B protein
MLFRLYNVEENTLLLDGYDIMKLPITTVRENIGYAPQDNFLFSDTVGSNIAFANAQLSENYISKAAQFSAVRDNIEGFDQKYKTMIGERGVTLSGGQKQRISISRAVVKDPAILVLDDSVSAVDIKTEEEILNNIKKLRAGKTTLLIASRVSTVEKLDKVLVLNEGKVEYFGTNEECMLHSPTYKRMVELQTLEKEMEG